MKIYQIDATVKVYEIDDEQGTKTLMETTEKSQMLVDPNRYSLDFDESIRMAKLDILDNIMYSILSYKTDKEKAREKAAFNARCEEFRAMRRKTKDLPIKDQLKAINDFRAGRFVSK